MADAVNDYVDKHFSASEHLPTELQKLLRPLEVATGQGALPVLAFMAAAMAGLNNGANIQLWTLGTQSATPAPFPPPGKYCARSRACGVAGASAATLAWMLLQRRRCP